jgi:MoaA/NifB/PqqE/SkfB family radical SAM enzyme
LAASERDSIFAPPGPAELVAEGSYGFVKPEHAEFPPIIIVAVTNLCNMACIHCAHPVIKKDADYRGTFMKPEVHARIVEETKPYRDQLWVLRYAADGESMLHPRFLD